MSAHLRIEWRSLAPRELDLERLWLGIGLATSGLAAAGWRLGVQPPRCLFHLVTGMPCPGCGSTRAILQLAEGHVAAAFAFNPLTTIAAFAALLYTVYAAIVFGLKRPRLRVAEVSHASGRVLRVAFFTAVAANWWWVIAHGW